MNAESALFTLMIFSLIIIFVNDNGKLHVTHPAPNSEQAEKPLFSSPQFRGAVKKKLYSLVAGAWTEREKMFHGGSFLKLADDNMDIQNPEAQNRELSGF